MGYLNKIFSTGAIRKTPDRIISRMADEVETVNENTVIIEAGAGMGEITEAILKKRELNSSIKYYAFETDVEACNELKEKFPAIKVLNASIFKFDEILPPAVKLDYFISSIPFSFYKNDMIKEFLEKVKLHLKDDGKIILLFTAAWLIPVFKDSLQEGKTEAFLTFPPYFVMVYEKSEDTKS